MPIVTRGLGGFALVTRGLGPLVIIYVSSKGYVIETDISVGDLDDSLSLDSRLTASTASQDAAVLDELYAELRSVLDGHHVYSTLSAPYAVAVSTDALGLARIYDALAEVASVTVVGPSLTASDDSTEATLTDTSRTTLTDGDI